MPPKIPAKMKRIASLCLCLAIGLIAMIGSIPGPTIFLSWPGTFASLNGPTTPAGEWSIIFEHPFPANYWSEGVHSFSFSAECPAGINFHSENGPAYAFSVDPVAAIQDSTVFIRMRGLYLVAIRGDAFGHVIHPSQKTAAIYTLFAGSFADAKRLQNECTITMQIDSSYSIELSPLEINQLNHRQTGKEKLHE